MNRNRFLTPAAFQTGHLVLSCSLAALAIWKLAVLFIMMLRVDVSAPRGGMTGLAGLVLMVGSAFAIIVTIGYGIMSVLSWWLSRSGFPVLAISFAVVNAVVLTAMAADAVRLPMACAIKAAYVALALISLALCVGLGSVRSPVREP